MGNPARVLLLARTGPLAEGLSGLLISLPDVQVVGPLKRYSLAPATPADASPATIIVESGAFGHEISAVIRELKTAFPTSRCIVIAEDVQQQQAALAAGADVALLQGCRPSELLAAVRGRSA